MIPRSPSCRECGLCEVPREAELSSLVESVVREVMGTLGKVGDRKVPIGVSARHMHVCQEDLEQLFGVGHPLTKIRDLNQPGEFAAEETVTVVGPKRRFFDVRILGPVRRRTQVELAYSDGIYLGLDLPHRLSGDIAGSAPIILVGPKGVRNLSEGAIRAKRHIHVNPQDAARLGVRNGQAVSVRTTGEMSLTFNNVVVREGEGLKLEMHVDTDEANAAGLRCGDPVELLPDRA
jgi:putative phosphotransacetylase